MLFDLPPSATSAASIKTTRQRAKILRVDVALAEAEVRRAVLQLAKQGSTPAQKQFQAYSQQANKTRLPRAPSK
jgi:hypothetical protein